MQAFTRDGYLTLDDVLDPDACDAVLAHCAHDGVDREVGSRTLLTQPWCAALARRLRTHPALARIIPCGHVAVQCTWFEKSATMNWLVPVHQDLSIPVAARGDEPGLAGWSDKEGQLFVQAPRAVLDELVAVRLHLDDCLPADGPLRVIPGSHRHGPVSPETAAALRAAGPELTCSVRRGGVLAMRPLLLHASSKASGQSRRRVLHFVYGPPTLPFGLAWPQVA